MGKSIKAVGHAKCPYCREWVDAKASKCPHCQAEYTPEDKAGLEAALKSDRRRTAIGCGALVIAPFLLLAFCTGGSKDPQPFASRSDGTSLSAEPATQAEPDPLVSLTPGQRNARRSAESYLAMKGFSRRGLIDQLTSEYADRYEVADATAAVDSLTVDWKEQAARSAESYLRMKGFSCQGLIGQLSSNYADRYTREEAEFGAKKAGAC